MPDLQYSENRDWVPAEFAGRALSEVHLSRLLDDGIPKKMIREARLFSVGPDDITRYTGVRVSCWGIGFPYPGEDGYVRFRLDEPQGSMKYVSRRGDGCRLYVPPSVDLGAPEVFVTEGEKKALAAASRGINCAAVAGIDSWRQRTDLGEKLPPEDALLGRLRRDWSGQIVVLVYDSDITPQHKRYDAFPTLAEVLYALGADGIKVLTLPELEAVEGKVGLDDYLLAYERAGEDGVARFRRLVERTPIWVPTSFGAKPWAEKILAERNSRPPEMVRLAMAALIAAEGKLAAKRRIKELFPRESGIAWQEAQRMHAEVMLRQRPAKRRDAQPAQPRAPEEEENLRTFAEAFPPAADTPFATYPIPPHWDIKPGGAVVKVQASEGEVEEKIVLQCPLALGAVLRPADGAVDDVQYEVWWYQDKAWKQMQLTAGVLFDHKRFGALADRGVPVDSLSAANVVAWLAALRDLLFSAPERAKLPERVVVTRSGWHSLDIGRDKGSQELFAVGRDIYTPGRREDGAAGETPDGADPDDPLTEWSTGASDGERQMLEAIRAKGSLEAQKSTYLKWFARYPLVAFFTGAGAAGPLIRYLVQSGESDVCGFVVETTDSESGRGKTTLNMFPAGLWGRPTLGDMIRTANRTTVHSEVLFSVHCDISAHIDESQLIRYADAIAEIVYSLALGMGRERGAKYGGSRKTRRWYSVLVISAERSVLDVVKGRQGVFDRVLSFPPLFPSKAEEYRDEAEDIAKELAANYGHLGRRYVAWLLEFPPKERERVILDAYSKWKNILDLATNRAAPDNGDVEDGASEKNQTMKRLAKRAAACIAGLELLLRAVGVPEEQIENITVQAADTAWTYVAGNTEGQAFLATALNVIRSYVAENRDLIEGLRPADVGKPPRWIGKVIKKDGVEYLALYPNAVGEALKRYADVEYGTAVRALKNAGLLLTSDDRSRNTFKTRLGGTLSWCLAIRKDAVLGAEEFLTSP